MPKHTHSVRALVSAGVVSFAGASNVIATLMEGLRRHAGCRATVGASGGGGGVRSSWYTVAGPADRGQLAGVFGHTVSQWLVASIGPRRVRDLRGDAAAALGDCVGRALG